MSTTADDDLAAVVRDHVAPIVTRLARTIGDFDVAEDAVADAVVEALDVWRRAGVPGNPRGWLFTAARHNAIDRLRRMSNYQLKLARLAALDAQPDLTGAPTDDAGDHAASGLPSDRDDRLALLFGCCHPALALDSRVALTLRAVVGLTTTEIARATLVPVPTVAQRITRAKRKITTAGISLRVPTGDALRQRLATVLLVVYLAYNEAYLATSDPSATRHDLARDAIWMAELLSSAFADEPEPLGLAALLRLQHARRHARVPDGALVMLADQDRSLWDRAEIAAAIEILGRAATMRRPGPFQLQAAIAACHAEAADWATTDWPQVLTLYDLLLLYDASPVVQLNRAIAESYVTSPADALRAVDEFADELANYHLLHATRADLLARLGEHTAARQAAGNALALTTNPAERRLLKTRYDL